MSVKEGPFVFISKKSTRYCSYGKSGEWSLRENAKYAAFIKKYVSII
jgi:hypothetical protein